MYALAPTDAQRMLRDSVQRAMHDVLTPQYLHAADADGRYPYEAYDAWVALGLTGQGIPEAHGGYGGGLSDLAHLSETLAYWSYDISTAFTASLFSALALCQHGSPAQRDQFLPALVEGRLRMATCISEPAAGSDVSAIELRARRDGDDWVLNGQKLWATGAGARNTLLLVYARTDPTAAPRAGLSAFLVENDRPGLTCRKLDMLGRRATGTYEIFFDDVRVPAERLMGGEHQGWSCLLSGLQAERALTSAGYAGAAQKVVDLAVAHAREREQFGRPIGQFQAIGHLLADMQTEVDAARLMASRAAWRLDQGLDSLREVSMAKLLGSETYARVANQGMQVLGASGYALSSEMQRHFRDARSTTIGAGSSQMQRNIIAATLGLNTR